MSVPAVNVRTERGPASVGVIILSACADATLYFDFVNQGQRPRNFTYCNLTAVELCLPVDEPAPRRLLTVRFIAREAACGPALIDLAAPQDIDFLVDEDAPANVYGVRVRVPAHATCTSRRQHRELAYALQATDVDGHTLLLASGLLVLIA